jgi:hypothetical protein
MGLQYANRSCVDLNQQGLPLFAVNNIKMKIPPTFVGGIVQILKTGLIGVMKSS